jgi:hypothetical protein
MYGCDGAITELDLRGADGAYSVSIDRMRLYAIVVFHDERPPKMQHAGEEST